MCFRYAEEKKKGLKFRKASSDLLKSWIFIHMVTFMGLKDLWQCSRTAFEWMEKWFGKKKKGEFSRIKKCKKRKHGLDKTCQS